MIGSFANRLIQPIKLWMVLAMRAVEWFRTGGPEGRLVTASIDRLLLKERSLSSSSAGP